MICPKCRGMMLPDLPLYAGEEPSLRCWICATRIWASLTVKIPMDAKRWKSLAIGRGPGAKGDKSRECQGCHEKKMLQTPNFCQKCRDRQLKGIPFDAVLRPGRG